MEITTQRQQSVAHTGLDVQTVIHQFEEVVVLAEDVLEVSGRLPCFGVVTDPQPGLDLTGGAAGRTDQPSGVFGQQLTVGSRVVEEALHRGTRGEPEQVVHPLRGLREQRHVGIGTRAGDIVVAAVVPAHPLALETGGVGREVGLAANDRLDPGRLGLRVEVVGPEHVAVVGHRHGRHPEFGSALEKVGQPCGTVKHGVLGVVVQVHKRVACHRLRVHSHLVEPTETFIASGRVQDHKVLAEPWCASTSGGRNTTLDD